MKSKLALSLFSVVVLAVWGSIPSGTATCDEGASSAGPVVIELNVGGPIAPARVPKTGQTTSYGWRDDGKLQKGLTWPEPRFTDNADGTVRDNLTGLVWLKNADCIAFYDGDGYATNFRSWSFALAAANRLADGHCGLTDGSIAHQWRLPNIKELQSLVDPGCAGGLPDTVGTGCYTSGDPFLAVPDDAAYWTSTTAINPLWPDVEEHAYLVDPGAAYSLSLRKTSPGGVWPVRGPTAAVSNETVFGTGPVPAELNEGGLIAPARVPKTGQTTSYRPRDDGDLRKGRNWPNPRFTDKGDGTVRDNLTGLVWLKNVDCITFFEGDRQDANWRPWVYALGAANRLADGYCGLADGSIAKQWRLPDINELQSLMDPGCPAGLPDTAGTGCYSPGDPFLVVLPHDLYWSSTTTVNPHFQEQAYSVVPQGSYGYPLTKDSAARVWPVRGPTAE